MSLMADFDFVAELSKVTLLRLIRANLKFPPLLGGELANPPFELTVPLSGGASGPGIAHFIIEELAITLQPDDRIELTMSFDRASVTVPGLASYENFDGKIIITIPVFIKQVAYQSWLTVDFGVAALKLDAPALGSFAELARATSEPLIRKLGFYSFLPVFDMVGRTISDGKPTGNGSLTPLRFVRLEAHRINPDSMGLFGILLAHNDSKGDHTLKDHSELTPGHNFCVSLSPELFHTLVFCPAIAAQFKKDVAALPGSCGAAGSIDLGGASLNSMSDSFADGHINVDATASKSGDCYKATLNLHAELSLSIDGSKLVPKLGTAEPEVDVDMPFLCHVAVAVISGPFGYLAIEVLKDGVAAVVNKLIGAEAGKLLPGTPFTSILGAQFSSIKITAEGLTVCGTLPVFLPPPRKRKLEIDGSVTDSYVEVAGAGIYTSKQRCSAGDYPYTERFRNQVGTYTAYPTLLGWPLKLLWSVRTGFIGEPEIPLTGDSGVVRLTVSRHSPFPLPAGSESKGPVNLSYKISGKQIQLTNDPEDEEFSFYLHVQAFEPGGARFEVEVAVQFVGHDAPIEGGYEEKVAACMAEALTYPPLDYRWPAVDLPSAEKMLKYIRTVIASGDPAADAMLAEARLAHGPAFHRAFAPHAMAKFARESETPFNPS